MGTLNQIQALAKELKAAREHRDRVQGTLDTIQKKPLVTRCSISLADGTGHCFVAREFALSAVIVELQYANTALREIERVLRDDHGVTP